MIWSILSLYFKRIKEKIYKCNYDWIVIRCLDLKGGSLSVNQVKILQPIKIYILVLPGLHNLSRFIVGVFLLASEQSTLLFFSVTLLQSAYKSKNEIRYSNRSGNLRLMPRKPLMTFMHVHIFGSIKVTTGFPKGTSDITHFFLAWHIESRYPLKKKALW